MIEPEELARFVEEVGKFRMAASRVQNFLRNFAGLKRIDDLIEEIFQVRKFLEREFGRRPNPKGGRPKSAARDALVYQLGLVYWGLKNKVPGRTVNPDTSELSGLFPDFTTKIFEFQGIDTIGLRHVIKKVRDALMLRTRVMPKTDPEIVPAGI
jgi:hypothetical protein